MLYGYWGSPYGQAWGGISYEGEIVADRGISIPSVTVDRSESGPSISCAEGKSVAAVVTSLSRTNVDHPWRFP